MEEGKTYLISARDNYQNYDFENRLNVRIHSALRYYSHLTHPHRRQSSSTTVGERNKPRASGPNRSNIEASQPTLFSINPNSDTV